MPYGNKSTMVQETPVAGAARTAAAGNSGAITGYGYATTLRAQLACTASSGTTPTLDVVIEDTLDGGTNWWPIATFTQLVAAGSQVVNITAPFGDTIRVRWTIGGGTPSFTFSVTWVADRPGA